MLGIFDDVDMSGLLAKRYIEKLGQSSILHGIVVFLLSSHFCRRSLFVRKILEIANTRFQRTNDLHSLSRLAHIYLNLAHYNTEYRRLYGVTIRSFFDRLPQRRLVLFGTLHETRYWAAANRHVDTLVAGSGILQVLETYFTRRVTGDAATFACTIQSLVACVSVLDRQATLPCVMCPDFASNVTGMILDNAQLCAPDSDLLIPSTQLLVLFCPASGVEDVMNKLIRQLCESVVATVSARTKDTLIHIAATKEDRGSEEESTLHLSVEYMTARPDLCKALENYFALKPCLQNIVSAGIAVAAQQTLDMIEFHDSVLATSQQACTRTQSHMNICSLAHKIITKCNCITEDEVSHILCYMDGLAKTQILGVLCFSVVLLLGKVVFTYSDEALVFQPSSLQQIVVLLRDAMMLTAVEMCSEEIVSGVSECIVCILAKQQTQLTCTGWDAICDVCCRQLQYGQRQETPCADRLVESLIVSARHTSLKTFRRLLCSLQGIYKGFGEQASMSSRRRRQFIDLLKIPLSRGTVLPRAELQLRFAELDILQHTKTLATLFIRLDNKSGRHTSGMFSIAQTLFMLILLENVEHSTYDLALCLFAKVISSGNTRDEQRLRVHTMMVELLGRYNQSAASNLPSSGSPSKTPCIMDPSLIRHLLQSVLRMPADMNFSEIPLQLCIISSLLSQGHLMCLCEKESAAEAEGAKACRNIYSFCLHVLATIDNMRTTAVHRHGLLLAQRILHRLLQSPFHNQCPLASVRMNELLLTHLVVVKDLLLTQPETFPVSAYAAGLVDNEAISVLLQRRSALPTNRAWKTC